MKRTYFVPMCVLGGASILCTAAALLLLLVFGDTLARSKQIDNDRFESQYKDPGNHAALYSAAVELRQKLASEEADSRSFTCAASFFMGLLLIWWAFDRRRLIRRCGQAAPP